jgi:hypothetical protein
MAAHVRTFLNLRVSITAYLVKVYLILRVLANRRRRPLMRRAAWSDVSEMQT